METARPRHTRKRTRLEAVDLLRGLLMILMVVDHTRIYFTNVRFNPTDPLLSWPVLFATRWITRKWTDARYPARVIRRADDRAVGRDRAIT